MTKTRSQPPIDKPEGCPFLTVVEAATYLGLRRQTLDNYRWQGGGPAYRKHGGRVFYDRSDLDRWSLDRSFISTAIRAPQHHGDQR